MNKTLKTHSSMPYNWSGLRGSLGPSKPHLIAPSTFGRGGVGYTRASAKAPATFCYQRFYYSPITNGGRTWKFLLIWVLFSLSASLWAFTGISPKWRSLRSAQVTPSFIGFLSALAAFWRICRFRNGSHAPLFWWSFCAPLLFWPSITSIRSSERSIRDWMKSNANCDTIASWTSYKTPIGYF